MMKLSKNRGYTIVELLFYITLFVILSLVVINSLSTMTKAFKEIRINGELADSGAIMERMAREIRQAHTINTLASTDVTLTTLDEGGADKTIRFVLSGANLQFYEEGSLSGNLNSANVAVSNLNFRQINTTTGSAVKISYTVRSLRDSQNRTYNFYNTAVLRGAY